jgi:hypothetical protein
MHPKIGISYVPYKGSQIKEATFDRVKEWATVVILAADREHPDLTSRGFDLFHMASWREESVVDLQRATAAGIPPINSASAALLTADRLLRCQTLQACGIHVPPFQFGSADEITLRPPAIIKPRVEFGPDSHRFTIVFSEPLTFEGERFVQRCITPKRSYKIFRVGTEVRSTRYELPDNQPRSLSPSPRFVTLTDRVRDLLGLALFELDIIVHKTVYVIDINPAVSLEAVDDAVDIYETLVELADEHLQRPVTTTVDTWEDGTFRIRVYHQRSPEVRETLYYHSAEGKVWYGVEAGETLRDDEVITTIEPPSGSKNQVSDRFD